MESIACFVAASQSLVRRWVTTLQHLVGPVAVSKSFAAATLSVHSGVTFVELGGDAVQGVAKVGGDAALGVADACASQHLFANVT